MGEDNVMRKGNGKRRPVIGRGRPTCVSTSLLNPSQVVLPGSGTGVGSLRHAGEGRELKGNKKIYITN